MRQEKTTVDLSINFITIISIPTGGMHMFVNNPCHRIHTLWINNIFVELSKLCWKSEELLTGMSVKVLHIQKWLAKFSRFRLFYCYEFLCTFASLSALTFVSIILNIIILYPLLSEHWMIRWYSTWCMMEDMMHSRVLQQCWNEKFNFS